MWMGDLGSLAEVMTSLGGAGIDVIIHPNWPVTPLNWVLKGVCISASPYPQG